MDEKTMVYLMATSAIAMMVLFGTAEYGDFGFLAALLAILAVMLIFIINYADFLVFPMVTSILGIRIVPAKSYYIPKANNCIIKYTNGLYYATGYLTANIYNYVFEAESEEGGEESKLVDAPEKWERIVMNAEFPFKFNIISAAEDIQKYRDALEGKRGVLEFQLSKEMGSENPSKMTIDDIQKQINILDARIDRLSGGERPVDSIMYVETIAVGVSEKEASDSLTNQLNHLQTLFSAFDVNISRVVGREMYHLFTFGYALPEEDLLTQIFTPQR
jgi:hypothetical protein